jgi:hypothetical protein
MLNRTTTTRAKNEGAVQMSKGMMGFFATLCSQKPKAPNKTKETTSRAVSYGVSHPTAGAWLNKY